MMSRIFGENLKKKSHMMLFELLPFFEFCTLQFCKCDISESIIGRGSKLLSASDVVSVSCFGVRFSVMFHFMFVHYTFRPVWVAEWPPFGK